MDYDTYNMTSDWLTNEEFFMEETYSNLSQDDFCEETFEEAPEPSKLRISTITATGKIVSENSIGEDVTDDGFLPLSLEDLYNNIEIDETSGPFISIEYAENPVRGFDKRAKKKKKTKKVEKKTKRKKFYNQSTLIVKMKNGNRVNLKIFRNGGIQMTGLKSVEEGIECVEKFVIPTINKLSINNSVIDKTYTSGENNLVLRKYNIVLINSDYTTNFKIKRDVLHYLLNTEYDILASFEPCIYPGVNAKYYWNEDYLDNDTPGVCLCTKKCNGKGIGKGDGECKKVTISTFQSGSVIITGARNTKQIYDSYEFINTIFRNHYSELKKKEIKIELPKTPIFKKNKSKKKKKFKVTLSS